MAALVLLCLLSSLLRASDALILIDPDKAEPIVAEENYLHGEWILWPPEDNPGSGNRLLSIFSGMDWTVPSNALGFGLEASGAYRSAAFEELRAKGYLARRDELAADVRTITSKTGSVSADALLLGLSSRSPIVTPRKWTDAWPGVIVAEATSWDEIQAIVDRSGGKALVIEYPPHEKKRWTRFWLRGPGWSTQLPQYDPWSIPGLIPASQAGSLLLQPDEFRWNQNSVANWGGANRWLTFTNYYAPLFFAIVMAFTTFFAGCATYLISREEQARVTGLVLKYFTLFPAAVLLCGRATVALGRDGVVAWLPLSFLILVVISQLLGGFVARILPSGNRMLAIGLVGFLATALSDPLWSLYSNVLGPLPTKVSPEAFGALAGYLIMVSGSARGTWLSHMVPAGTLAWGVIARPWWVGSDLILLLMAIAAWFCGQGWFRPWQLIVAFLAPLADGQILRHGLTWAPGNLNSNASSFGALNLARHVEFLASPGFMTTAVVAGGLAVFVERFFFHRLRQVIRKDPRMESLFHGALVFGAMGLSQPPFLYAALLCFVGGSLSLLAEAARPIEPAIA